MSHEHEHEHSQAAPKRTSRFGPERGWTGTGQPAEDHGLTPAQEQQWRAARLHQGRQVLQGWAARAAARASAPTDAAHAAHDEHMALAGAAHGGHAVQEGTEATRAAPAGGQPGFNQVHFDQVYTDVAGGKFAVALGLLDRYWPLGARDRDFVGGLIVSKLYAALAPLPMERMLHTLQTVRPYLGEVIMGGHRLRDLLLYPGAGPALNHDRLAFALTIVSEGTNALTPANHEDQTQALPQYLVGPDKDHDHFDDLNGAVRYLEGTHGRWRGHTAAAIFGPMPLVPEMYDTYITAQNLVYREGAMEGTQQAINAIAGDGPDYSAFWLSVAGAAVGAVTCLAPEVAPGVVLAFAVAGGVVQGVSSLPHDATSLHDAITSTLGDAGVADRDTLCGRIEAIKGPQIRAVLDNVPRDTHGQPLWGDYEVKLHLLKQFFAPELIRLYDGGEPSIDWAAVVATVKRSLLLGAVGFKSRHGSQGLGRVLYRYNAANVFYQGGLELNPPDRWTYTLAETALVVVPQLRQAVADQIAREDIAGADLVGPKAIVVNQQYIFLDQTNAVDTTDFAMSDQWVYDEAQQRDIREPAATFAGAIRDAAWGNKEKRPPRTAIQRVTDSLSS